MVEPAQGFLTKSGQFFATAEEAEFHEANEELVAAVHSMKINPEVFINILENFPTETMRWLNAYKANILDLTPATPVDPTDDRPLSTSPVEQSSGRKQSVPDVWVGP